MIDFTLGFIAGSLIVAISWKMTAQQKSIFIIKDAAGEHKILETPVLNKVAKPDNKKAAYYSSDEYKNERAFIEEQKKLRESIS